MTPSLENQKMWDADMLFKDVSMFACHVVIPDKWILSLNEVILITLHCYGSALASKRRNKYCIASY